MNEEFINYIENAVKPRGDEFTKDFLRAVYEAALTNECDMEDVRCLPQIVYTLILRNKLKELGHIDIDALRI